jgi:hypothetical protein
VIASFAISLRAAMAMYTLGEITLFSGAVRSERFYFDGARRVQEVVTDPLATIGLAGDPEGESNNPGLGEQLSDSVPPGQQASGDPEGTPLSFEQSQMQGQAENPQPLIGVGGDPLPAMLGGAAIAAAHLNSTLQYASSRNCFQD